jgi:signal transduction histidine kinase
VEASSLRIFVPDDELGIFVAAQGLSSILPVGPAWDQLLSVCRLAGIHHAAVPEGDGDQLVPATAYVEEGGSVLVFVGVLLKLEAEQLALPLLGALFRAEQRSWAAHGEAFASREAARHANALTAALDRSRTELERAIQAKQQVLKEQEMLLGIVGHDLRNPLSTVVMGTSLLIEGGDLPAGHVKTLLRIKKTALRMSRMIADLLDFERCQQGTIPIAREDNCLRDVVAQVTEELEVIHPTRTIEYIAHGDGQGNWDADRLAQVVSNLLGNALQHSPPNTPVRISLTETINNVMIQVRNEHRKAISEQDLMHIFEPFRRSKESTGLGLGLYIVQQIAKAHGGRVDATSEAEYTTFTVELPRGTGGE